MGLCSIIAAFDKGKRLTAPVRSSTLTSSFLSGGFPVALTAAHVEGTGIGTIWPLGLTPIIELPFGSSLRRTVFEDCSLAFACTLRLGEGVTGL